MQSRIPDQQIELTWDTFVVGPVVGIDAPTTNHARFIKSGQKVDMLVNIGGTISIAPVELTFTLPVPVVTAGGIKSLTCLFTEDGGATWDPAVCLVTMSDNLCHIQKSGGIAFVNGPIEISVNGAYEVA